MCKDAKPSGLVIPDMVTIVIDTRKGSFNQIHGYITAESINKVEDE